MTHTDPNKRPSTEELLLNSLVGDLKKFGTTSTNTSTTHLQPQASSLEVYSCQNSFKRLDRVKSRERHKKLEELIINNGNKLKRSLYAPGQEANCPIGAISQCNGKLNRDIRSIVFEDNKETNEEVDEVNEIATEYNKEIESNIQ